MAALPDTIRSEWPHSGIGSAVAWLGAFVLGLVLLGASVSWDAVVDRAAQRR